MAALAFPSGKDWQLAKAAGYSDRSNGSLRVKAHSNLHNEKVIAAMHEEAGKRLRSSAILGASVLAKIARTDGHKHQLRAAEALLNRIGLHETTEHRVTVQRSDDAVVVARIRELARELGLDPRKLGVAAPPMLEARADVVDVKAEEIGDG